MSVQSVKKAKIQTMSAAGRVWFCKCPNDGKFILLSCEIEGDSVWCPKCRQQIKLTTS